jgi:hypothetical protein
MGGVNMGMTLETRVEHGYLRATVRGRFVLASANEQFLRLLDEIVDEGTHRVLIDGRGVTGRPRALERYLYGQFIARATNRLPVTAGDLMGAIPWKFAYVLEYPVLDPGRLGEQTARNSGMHVRAFHKYEQAVEWLLGADL